ncbi:MAG: MCD, Malonyl-CoA decarboxylase MCD, partial [Alphaproteobacteria bacterium]|nr:MCD, Malonyl-CoA decarboxylase MCD [Alphaproteobacteria bacterium]
MPERQRDILSELLQAVAHRSRKLLGLANDDRSALPTRSLVDALLSTHGEASGVALARVLLDRWNAMSESGRIEWFLMLARDLGPDQQTLKDAVAAWLDIPTPGNAGRLHQ